MIGPRSPEEHGYCWGRLLLDNPHWLATYASAGVRLHVDATDGVARADHILDGWCTWSGFRDPQSPLRAIRLGDALMLCEDYGVPVLVVVGIMDVGNDRNQPQDFHRQEAAGQFTYPSRLQDGIVRPWCRALLEALGRYDIRLLGVEFGNEVEFAPYVSRVAAGQPVTGPKRDAWLRYTEAFSYVVEELGRPLRVPVVPGDVSGWLSVFVHREAPELDRFMVPNFHVVGNPSHPKYAIRQAAFMEQSADRIVTEFGPGREVWLTELAGWTEAAAIYGFLRLVCIRFGLRVRRAWFVAGAWHLDRWGAYDTRQLAPYFKGRRLGKIARQHEGGPAVAMDRRPPTTPALLESILIERWGYTETEAHRAVRGLRSRSRQRA